jgi:hypothetical protein
VEGRKRERKKERKKERNLICTLYGRLFDVHNPEKGINF